MYSRNLTSKSTKNYSDKVAKIREKLHSADAILIGAGAGLSSAAGHTYTGQRFKENFADFHNKYSIVDIYSGGFYPYETLEEYWAWWSRHIDLNRYREQKSDLHQSLLNLVKDKNYFVLTTNVDHLFQSNGFDKDRLFYTQGDYGLWQCSKACHNKTYDNEEMVKEMVEKQHEMKIPSKLVPKCPICGSPLTMNLRCDNYFVQDKGWHTAYSRYEDFVSGNENKKILLLELGVGDNTPIIIKYPFWRMAVKNLHATYACINIDNAVCPIEIEEQSICVEQDISSVIDVMVNN